MKYKYLIRVLRIECEQTLNELGGDGWELISIIPTNSSIMTCYFKKGM